MAGKQKEADLKGSWKDYSGAPTEGEESECRMGRAWVGGSHPDSQATVSFIVSKFTSSSFQFFLTCPMSPNQAIGAGLASVRLQPCLPMPSEASLWITVWPMVQQREDTVYREGTPTA